MKLITALKLLSLAGFAGLIALSGRHTAAACAGAYVSAVVFVAAGVAVVSIRTRTQAR